MKPHTSPVYRVAYRVAYWRELLGTPQQQLTPGNNCHPHMVDGTRAGAADARADLAILATEREA